MASNDSPALANAPASVATPNNSPTTALFQKAHAKMVTLQRVEEQLGNLAEQRKKLQDELRAIQTQINDEFNRLVPVPAESATDAAATPAPSAPIETKPKRNGSNGAAHSKDAIRLEVAESL